MQECIVSHIYRHLYDVPEDEDEELIGDDEPYQQNESYSVAGALRLSDDDFMASHIDDIPPTLIDAKSYN